MFKFVRRDPGHSASENLLTPLEIAALIGSPGGEDFLISEHLRTHRPKRFRRREITEGVTLYSAGVSARGLLVVFCGKAHRPMLPISALLQMLDDEAFDVLMLDDNRRRHFEHGVYGFAGSMIELVSRIERIAGRRGILKILTFGTSMGGFPALRVGRMLRAERAISVGGRFAWHIHRLEAKRNVVRAYDALCACTSGVTPCVNLFAKDNAIDAAAAAQLNAMLPGSTQIGLAGSDHNVLKTFFKADRIDDFCRQVFDPERAPTEAELAAAMASAPKARLRESRAYVDL